MLTFITMSNRILSFNICLSKVKIINLDFIEAIKMLSIRHESLIVWYDLICYTLKQFTLWSVEDIDELMSRIQVIGDHYNTVMQSIDEFHDNLDKILN